MQQQKGKLSKLFTMRFRLQTLPLGLWLHQLQACKSRNCSMLVRTNQVCFTNNIIRPGYNDYNASKFIQPCLKQSSRKLSNGSSVVAPVFFQAERFKDNTALTTQHGTYTYKDLLHYSVNFAKELTVASKTDGRKTLKDTEFPLEGERIAFLCENDLSYVVAQWAIWMCKAIAVPLCKSHPVTELQYFCEDSSACMLVGTAAFRDKLAPISSQLGRPLLEMGEDDYSGDYSELKGNSKETFLGLKDGPRKNEYKNRKAMIIYTSGTTGTPKGVVMTFGNLDAQMRDMVQAWGWSQSDSILHVLPLHHVHGVVNVLMTPLYVGAKCTMLPKFDAKQTWQTLLSDASDVNIFMAVPTIYSKLIQEYERQRDSQSSYLPSDLPSILKQKFRLMVSGSAALPQPVMERWADLTGHLLLERYGMTEIGMALTNPLIGDRFPGAVGLPFPGVSARIVEHHDNCNHGDVLVSADAKKVTVTKGKEGLCGELLIKGDNVFTEYWNRPSATAEAFTGDGWFKTGDTAVFADGVFHIVGRTSVDVIKSAGYKISALDVERHLLAHPDIQDVAVIGLPDMTYGQLLTAVLVTKSGATLTTNDLQIWAKDKMAPYHIPRKVTCLKDMPRNAMGKVNKKQLAKDLFPDSA
ncbi:malonate--CoA ligase ACSF3, mitochondrial-like isoform X1 [Dreissena polymorpha]|nr:malonate--CoA ligase ACSF3, mitochondrial-like isoform X1 [Dreissena polymorpha]XP_052230657.1 malonate--CoA ligase ACSF3, mitochondrial-like isoform X1 [Dreissena polymorpha]